jgi:AcrR family transcriptional regulator
MNRDEQKKATALKIIASAKQLFSDQGYDATSTRQIATHAGVGVGTVFSHFKDKHQLTKVLFFNELEQQISPDKAIIDQGGLNFFDEQAKLLFQFYDKDKALAKAFLQNALFETDFFAEQLDGFIRLIAKLLTMELPGHSEEQRIVIANAWMGYYFQALLKGLADERSNAKVWHQSLMSQCRALLNLLTP